MYKDIRDYIAKLESDGELKNISGDVQLDCTRKTGELDAITKHLIQNNGPALLVDGSCLKPYNTKDIPVLINLFGSPKRTAMVVGETDLTKARDKICALVGNRNSWLDPVIVGRNQAPCQEIVIPEKEVDVCSQIPIVYFGKEGSPYITCGVEASKDPESGVLNHGWYRLAILDVDPEGKPFPQELRKKHR